MAARWGSDPLQRILRTVSVIAFLALVAIVVLDPDGRHDIALLSLLVFAVLLQLGYDGVSLVIPGLVERRDTDKRERAPVERRDG